MGDGLTTVVMQKFNTRANKNASSYCPSRPSYKVWNLRVIQKHISFTFLYCERGEEAAPPPPPLVTDPPPSCDLNSSALLGSWPDAFPDFIMNTHDIFSDFMNGPLALDLSL